MKKLFTTMFAMALSASIVHVNAQADVRKKQFNVEKSGLAIEGYDPVAYFTQNKAIKGNKDFAYSYQNIVYYFASAQNRDAFKANPAKYEPQYGGWCAYAMGKEGSKVEVDPETFKIRNGKLFLFYHSWTNNTLDKWNKDESNLNTRADASWSKIFH